MSDRTERDRITDTYKEAYIEYPAEIERELYPIKMPEPVYPAYLEEVVYEEGEVYNFLEFDKEWGYEMTFSNPDMVVRGLTYPSTKKTATNDKFPCRRWHRTTLGMLLREIGRYDRTY